MVGLFDECVFHDLERAVVHGEDAFDVHHFLVGEELSVFAFSALHRTVDPASAVSIPVFVFDVC